MVDGTLLRRREGHAAHGGGELISAQSWRLDIRLFQQTPADELGRC